MLEIDQLGKNPEQTLNFLTEVSRDAGGRILSRMALGQMNVALRKMPLGGEEGLDNILSFMPMAKEGFALNLRSSDVEKNETFDLLRITKPVSLNDFASQLGITLRSRIIREEPRLSIFRHAMATLAILSEFSKVDSEWFGVPVSGVSLWPYKPDKEKIWELLTELEDSTRKIIMDPRDLIGKEPAMRALHFFAASKNLSEKLK